MMWPDDPNWQMSVLYVLAIMGFVMKAVVMPFPATFPEYRPRVFWLLLSPASNRRLRPVKSVRRRLQEIFGGAD